MPVLAVTPSIDSPPAITGSCNPTRVHFTGHITTDAPAKVTYTWVRTNHPPRAVTVDITKAGSIPVSYDLLIRKSEEGWVMLRIVLPTENESAKVKYSVKCK